MLLAAGKIPEINKFTPPHFIIQQRKLDVVRQPDTAQQQRPTHWHYIQDKRQKPRRIISGVLLKNWRLPTLAEPIGLLPSARLCLTAEFGMGSGRTTALWPPRNGSQKPAAGSSNFHSELRPEFPTKFKRTNRIKPGFSENCTQDYRTITIREF